MLLLYLQLFLYHRIRPLSVVFFWRSFSVWWKMVLKAKCVSTLEVYLLQKPGHKFKMILSSSWNGHGVWTLFSVGSSKKPLNDETSWVWVWLLMLHCSLDNTAVKARKHSQSYAGCAEIIQSNNRTWGFSSWHSNTNRNSSFWERIYDKKSE